MVKVVCDTCGKEFRTTLQQSKRNHHFCNPKCYQEWRKTRTGTLNPHWRGGTVTNNCPQCNKAFVVILSQVSKRIYCSKMCQYMAHRYERLCLNCGKSYQGHLRKYCSYSCHLENMRINPRHCTPETKGRIAASKRGKHGLNGSANPMYKDGNSSTVIKTCPICEISFSAPAYRIYCSRECMAKDGQQRRDRFMATPEGKAWREISSKQMSGEGNPRWNNGASRKPHSFDFSPKLKKQILERDNYTCFICGSNEKLLIHHRDNSKTNSSPDNLITLCRPCHSGLHARKESIPVSHKYMSP